MEKKIILKEGNKNQPTTNICKETVQPKIYSKIPNLTAELFKISISNLIYELHVQVTELVLKFGRGEGKIVFLALWGCLSQNSKNCYFCWVSHWLGHLQSC